MRVPWLPILYLVVACTGIGAQTLTVAYMDGPCEFQSGTAWKPLVLGSSPAEPLVVRVPPGTTLILQYAHGTIHLSEGTHRATDLARQAPSNPPGLIQSLGQKLQALGQGRQRVTAVAGGVRASQAADPFRDMVWVEDESAGDLVAQGNESLAEGLVAEALAFYRDALDLALPHEDLDIRSQIFQGTAALAWPALGQVAVPIDAVDPSQAAYPAFNLDLATFYLQTGRPQLAQTVLEEALPLLSDPEDAQLNLYLQALVSLGLGDEAAYQARLKGALDRAPRSAWAASMGSGD